MMSESVELLSNGILVLWLLIRFNHISVMILTSRWQENGYINVAMLTGDKKPVEIEQAGKQLTLEDNSAPANSTGEVYPDVEEEVSDGEPVVGEC